MGYRMLLDSGCYAKVSAAGTHPRSLPQSIWYLGISRPLSYPCVAFDKLRVSGGPRLWGDQPDSVKRMIRGTMIAVVARVAITPAKRRYRTP